MALRRNPFIRLSACLPVVVIVSRCYVGKSICVFVADGVGFSFSRRRYLDTKWILAPRSPRLRRFIVSSARQLHGCRLLEAFSGVILIPKTIPARPAKNAEVTDALTIHVSDFNGSGHPHGTHTVASRRE